MPLAKAFYRGVIFLRALWFFSALTLCGAEPAETLSNQSVIELKEAGLSDALVIEKVKASKQKFDLSVAGLKKLKEAGISDPVLSAMFSVFNATPNQEPLPETKPQPSPEDKKRDEIKEKEREYGEKFDRLVAGGYTGNLSRKAYWKAKTDVDTVASAIRRAIDTSDPKWQVLQEVQPSADTPDIERPKWNRFLNWLCPWLLKKWELGNDYLDAKVMQERAAALAKLGEAAEHFENAKKTALETAKLADEMERQKAIGHGIKVTETHIVTEPSDEPEQSYENEIAELESLLREKIEIAKLKYGTTITPLNDRGNPPPKQLTDSKTEQ